MSRRQRLASISATTMLGIALAFVQSESAYGANLFTPTQDQILNAIEVTASFGGNGSILSRTPDGDGVLFTITGGTIDFGKVAARVHGPFDFSSYDGYALRVDVVLAPNPVEINPFIQTGSSGLLFAEAVPGVKQQGDSFDAFVSFAGVADIEDCFGFGFQYFTGGDVMNPPAQAVLIRVSPIPEPYLAACSNGFDDDRDGLVDLADPGCAGANDDSENSPALAACSNGLDDDRDGLVDLADPGCANAASKRENPLCQDGIDNEGDGTLDFDGGASAHQGIPLGPPDPKCVNSYENRETNCGLGVELALVMPLLGLVASRRRRAN